MTNGNSAESELKLSEYNRLSKIEKFLVEVLSVWYESADSATILEHMKKIRLAGVDTAHLTIDIITPLIDNLVTRGVIVKNAKRGKLINYRCHMLLMNQVFYLLHREGRLPLFSRAIEKSSSRREMRWTTHGWTYFLTVEEAIRELRIALFTGAALTEIQTILRGVGIVSTTFFEVADVLGVVLDAPICYENIKDLPPGHVEFVVQALSPKEMRLLEPESGLLQFIETYCRNRQDSSAQDLRFIYCYRALFSGHVEFAAAMLNNFSVGEQESSGRIGIAAWISFLRGDTEAAITHFEQDLGLLKKLRRTKKFFYSNYFGVFHLLALIKKGGLKNLEKALSYVDCTTMKDGHSLCGFSLCIKPVILTLMGRLEEVGEPYIPQPGRTDHFFLTFICALCWYWLKGVVPPAIEAYLKNIQSRALDNGYPWLGAETSLLLARMDIDKEQNEKKALDIHRKLGTVSILDAVPRQEPWERALGTIISMAGSSDSGRTQEANSSSSSNERLVWIVGCHIDQRYITVAPRLQKRDKKGGWSGGRNMALETLVKKTETMDFLTEADRKVIRTITAGYDSSHYGYYSRRVVYEFNVPKALLALVGHPLVFREYSPSTRLEIVTGSPELIVRKDSKSINLAISNKPSQIWPGLDIVEESPTRLRIVTFSEEQLRLVKLIDICKSLPLQAEPLVRQTVSSVSPLITVQSDIGADAANIEDVEGSERLIVRLTPIGRGLRGELLVRPFATGGAYYGPGAGAENVIAEIGGKRLRALRNLEREKDLARQLLTRCPTVASLGADAGHWASEDPETCLEMLHELQGFEEGVALEWPEGKGFNLRGTASVKNFSFSIRSTDDWFEASGEVKIDEDLAIDIKALLELSLNRIGRFVMIDEKTFVALEKGLARSIEDLRHIGEESKKGVRVSPAAAQALFDIADEAGSFKGDAQWKRHKARLQETVDPVLPSTLQAELRDYQISGFKWLAQLAHWGMGGCLADDMGLGKTVQALAAILMRAPEGPTLVVAPLSVLMNWRQEAARFAPTLQVKQFGQADRKTMVAELGPFDLVLSSYGLLLTEADLLSTVSWQTVVLDEAQAIKNIEAKRSMAAMRLSAGFRFITTGTPVENHLGELWTLFRFLNPGLLGSYKRFQERFASPIEKDGNKQARERLKKLVRPFILRRLKSQVLTELPPRTEILIQVEPNEAEAALYEAQRQLSLEKLSSGKDANPGKQSIKILAEIMRLRRLCCNPALVLPGTRIPSAKLAAFGDLVEELIESRHKVLVFSQFVDHLAIITKFLDDKKISYQYLDGQTSPKDREWRVKAFQSGSGDVFCISLKAGGMGLNLTAADYVIHMDPWWNPAVEDQASDRAHRIGQQRPVTVYRLIMNNTIEGRIIKLHERKRGLADNLLEGTDVAGKISPEELLELIQEERG